MIETQAQALEAALTSAIFAPLDDIGWIRVTGDDRVRWLNGMVTNSIAALTPGDGCYCFVLNAQGRIQGDLTAFALEDSILLETGRQQVEPLIAYFERFIIMDDVELAPVEDLQGILAAGPDAAAIVMALGTPNGQAAPCWSSEQALNAKAPTLKPTLYAGAPVRLMHAHSPLVPRFEIWSDSSTIASILEELRATNAVAATAADVEHLRVLEGTPLYGTDIRNSETAKDLPQETSQTRALHFAKGCYLGQEIVERIRSRGNVHRGFTGFALEGALPAAGTQLFAEGTPEKPIGELTSVTAVPLPSGPKQIALGYIRREALDRGATILYAGGRAIPNPLPFPISTAKSSS
jgi:aminomethyltransferase